MVSGLFGNLQSFLNAGGSVLNVILLAIVVLWILIFERYLFFKWELPSIKNALIERWGSARAHKNWFEERELEADISKAQMKIEKGIPMIKTLVALCPLLGLLGTVTGMIAVFDVLALSGTGNARMMASGISMATIPTMAGMVGALSGLFFGAQLDSKSKRIVEDLTEQLNQG